MRVRLLVIASFLFASQGASGQQLAQLGDLLNKAKRAADDAVRSAPRSSNRAADRKPEPVADGDDRVVGDTRRATVEPRVASGSGGGCGRLADPAGTLTIRQARLYGGTPDSLNTFQRGAFEGKTAFYWEVLYSFDYDRDAYFQLRDNNSVTYAVPADGSPRQRLLPQDISIKTVRFEPRASGQGRWLFLFPTGSQAQRQFALSGEVEVIAYAQPDTGRLGESSAGTKRIKFAFPAIPAQCGGNLPTTVADADERPVVLSPDGGSANVPKEPDPLLVQPSSVAAGARPDPKFAIDSPRFAYENGTIWALGDGVVPDYPQATLWFVEALRRQAVTGDYSAQPKIRAALADIADNRIARLQADGQRAASMRDWKRAQYYFGRAALQGDVQSMAALGYSYGADGSKQPSMEKYWCLRAVAGAKSASNTHEIDAVNHFCPKRIVESQMTARERSENQRSIERAERKSSEYRAELEATSRFAKAFTESASGPGPAHGLAVYKNHYDKDGRFTGSTFEGFND